MKRDLVIFGTGETARLAFEYFKFDSNYNPVCFCVDVEFKKDDFFLDLPIITTDKLNSKFPPEKYDVFVAIGSGKLSYQRKAAFEKIKSLGYKLPSYISSKAFVWRDVKIGENCFILENNVLQSGVKIGDNVVLWSGNHVGHLTEIQAHCFITSHVVISGNCVIGENTFAGVNSCFADNIKVGRDNFIGMGAVVNKSTAEDGLYVGNPAMKKEISARKFCKV